MQKSHGCGRSDVGRRRQGNEDCFRVDEELGLYVVADGMGGHQAGEVAAQLTVDLLRETVLENRARVAEVADGRAGADVLASILEQGILLACRRIYDIAGADLGKRGMGCTCTAVLHAGSHVALGHVGDSRMYLLRHGEVTQLSADHTVGAEMLLAGTLSKEEIDALPFAGTLSRAVGTEPAVKVDTMRFEALPGDRYVLCSDGLSRYLDGPKALLGLFGADLEAATKQMIDHANASGGKDNVTAVVVVMDEEEPRTTRHISLANEYDALGAVYFLEHLDRPLLGRVMAACRVEDHHAGDVALAEGAACHELLVVVGGKYRVTSARGDGGELAVGDYGGSATLFHSRPARATITAVEPSRMLRLDGERLKRLIRKRPWLGIGLLERIGRRMSSDLDRSWAQREGSGEAVVVGETF